jgi:hypothetical protein
VTQALYGAAAADPELDGYLGELIAGVGRQVRRILEVCREREWLRDDVPFDELVETVVVISSLDTFIRMVHRDGWTGDAYRAWFRRMVEEVVLRPRQPNVNTKPSTPASRNSISKSRSSIGEG